MAITSAAPDPPTPALSDRQFALMLAMTMAMTALAIDVMLPAFGEIREAMDLPAGSSDTGALITVFFLGLAIAQIPAGLLADRFGRKPVLHIGLVLYALGAVGAMFAPSLGWMLVGRFLWGLGAGGPRVVAVAIVRDRYSGDRMARMMSFVMAMFILIPIVAPSIGSALLAIGPWQLVFGFCALVACAVNLWCTRLPETLHPEHRRPLQLRPILLGARTVVRSRETVLLGVALTAVMASFMSYLASAELIIEETFDLGGAFPVIFGGLAVGMGLATFTNGRIVERIGMWSLLRVVLAAYAVVTGVVLLVALATDGVPPVAVYMPLLAIGLANHSLLVPNLNSAAMQPVGAVAGTASALLGTVTIAAGSLIGSRIDQAFDGTVRPLSIAFFVSSLVALVCFTVAHRGRPDVDAVVEPVAEPA